MWYKWAQKQVSEWEIPPDQWGISKKQVENMINRIKALSKNYRFYFKKAPCFSLRDELKYY